MRHLFFICYITVSALLAWSGNAWSGQLPREHKADFSAVRLLNGGIEDGVWQAGIQLDLKPGWKTYWRVPGESGIPPNFDTSASTNASQVVVHMPLPSRFQDENGEGIGYKNQVVFPVSLKPLEDAKPARLVLTLEYGLCKDICLPVRSQVSLELSAATKSASDAFRLKLASRKVPAAASGQGISVSDVSATGQSGKETLAVSLSGVGKAGAGQVDIFVETGLFAYVRKPKLVSQTADTATYEMKVDALDSKTSLKGQTVKLTIASGETGLVQDVVVK